MKNRILLLCATALIAGTFGLGSCERIKDEIVSNIDPFTYSQPGINFEIPAGPAIPFESPEQTIPVNINQAIRENAGLNVDIDNFSSIKMKSINLHLVNGDENTNWTSFESIEVWINTTKGLNASKEWLRAMVNIPVQNDQRYTDKLLVFKDINLKDYLDGESTVIHYKFRVEPRSLRLKALGVEATMQFEFRP